MTDNLIQYIKASNIRIVIPELGKLIYAGLPNRDYILVYTVDKGYIEGDNLDSCKALSEYLKQIIVAGATIVGNLDTVRKKDKLVYRQRITIQSLTSLLTICKKMNIKLIFPKELRLGVQQFEYVGNSIGLLTKYYTLYHSNFPTMESWLLTSFLLQFSIVAELSNVKYKIECEFLQDKVQDCLYRCPYVACTIDKYSKFTTVLDLDLETIKYAGKPLFSEALKDTAGYSVKNSKKDVSNNDLFVSGYSKRNIKEDRKRGCFNAVKF